MTPRAVTGSVIYHYYAHPCSHRVHLDLHGDRSRRSAPGVAGRYLMERGNRHEARIFGEIAERHPDDCLNVAPDPAAEDREADIQRRIRATEDAMRQGVRFILHGFLSTRPDDVVERRPGGEDHPRELVFRGETDILVRSDDPSPEFGAWSYQVGDVKSSARARFAQKMQVTFYAWILERLQGVMPREGFIVTGEGKRERFETEETRWTLRHFLEEEIHEYARGEGVFYQVESACGHCHWHDVCAERATEEDDLSLVPGLRRSDKRTLVAAGIPDRAALRAADESALRALGRSHGRRLDGFRELRLRARAQDFGQPVLRRRPAAGPPPKGAGRPLPDLFRHRGPILLIATMPDFYDGQEALIATRLLRRRGRQLEDDASTTFLHHDPARERLFLFGRFLRHKDELDALLGPQRESALPVFLDGRSAWRMRRNAESSGLAEALAGAERLLSDAVVLPELVEEYYYLPRETRDTRDLARMLAPDRPVAAGVFAEGALAAFLERGGHDEEVGVLHERVQALAEDFALADDELRRDDEDLRPIFVKEWRRDPTGPWPRLIEFELDRELDAGRATVESLLGLTP